MSEQPLLHRFTMQRTHRDMIRWTLLLRGKSLVRLLNRRRRRGDTADALAQPAYELACVLDTLGVMKGDKQIRALKQLVAGSDDEPIWTHNPLP